MNKKQLIIFVAIIGILGIFFACTLSDDGEETSSSTYKITYDGNGNIGGTVPSDNNTYEEGVTVPVLTNAGSLSRIPDAGTGEAFKFLGWNTQINGNGIDFTEGSAFTMGSANVTLYAKWGAFDLRDTGPSGNLIFYDKGVYNSGWRYLEAAPTDQGSSEWIYGVTPQNTENGNTSTAIGSGQMNSEYIIDQFAHERSAAEVCLNYVYSSTYSDWFLPSLDELTEMYNNLHDQLTPLGGFGTVRYWSSSEQNAIWAWAVSFFNGTSVSNLSKNNSCYVRPIRAF